MIYSTPTMRKQGSLCLQICY